MTLDEFLKQTSRAVQNKNKDLLKPKFTEVQKVVHGHESRKLEDRFLVVWNILNGPHLEREFRFHPDRKWRLDFCHLPTRTAIEIDGGIWRSKGAHSGGTAIIRDIEKGNELTFMGYRLIRFHEELINKENLERLIRFLQT